LVLLHDGLLDRRVWEHQFEAFAQEFRVIRYDRRGYGGSGAPRKEFSDVEDLHRLLKHLGISKVWLMGASNVGRIVVDFALEHPEMVDALVLVGPALSGYSTSIERRREIAEIFSAARTEGVSRGVEIWMEDPFWPPAKDRKLAREKVREILAENLPKVLSLISMPNLGIASSPSAVERLHWIGVPTLIVVGERDHADNLAIAALLEREVLRARKVMLPGAGHLPMMEIPQEFDPLVLSFLRERATSIKTN